MSARLKDLLELPEPKQGAMGDQAEEFRQSFTDGMAGVNRHLQALAGQANSGAVQPLESQKLKLYEAFQKTSALIDPNDPSVCAPAIERIMAAIKGVESKAAEAASGVTAGRDAWLEREEEFDDMLVRTGELEEAGNPKAAVLRKLAESIRSRANDCDYKQSSAALDQLRPKFDQIYQQHQEESNVPGYVQGGPKQPPKTDEYEKTLPDRPQDPYPPQKQPSYPATGGVLKEGARGPEVVKLQKLLLGISPDLALKADGVFGPSTTAAVRSIQKSRGLKVDGIVGPKTWSALDYTPSQPTPPNSYPPQPPKKVPPTEYDPNYPSQPPKKQPPEQYQPPAYPSQPPKKTPPKKQKPSYPSQPPKYTPPKEYTPPQEYTPPEEYQPPQEYAPPDKYAPPQEYAPPEEYTPPQQYEPHQMEEYGQGDKPPVQDDYANQGGYTETETRGSSEYPLAEDNLSGQSGYSENYQGDTPYQPDPLQMEEFGDASQGERIQMEGMTEDQDSGLPSFGVEPGAFLNDSGRVAPPGRDDPVVGQNRPVDPDDKFAGVKGTFDEILGVFGLSGVFSDVPGAKGDPAEFNPDKPTKSGPTRFGHLKPKDGPLESDPPPVPTAPTNTDPPPPPPLRTWGAPDPDPSDPNFIGPPAPPVTNSLSQFPDGIEDAAERLFGGE